MGRHSVPTFAVPAAARQSARVGRAGRGRPARALRLVTWVSLLAVAVPGAGGAQTSPAEPPPSPPREVQAPPAPAVVEPPTVAPAQEPTAPSREEPTPPASPTPTATPPPPPTPTSTPPTTATPTPTPPPTATPTPTPTPTPTAYEPYSPPGMTWAPAPPSPSADPSAASSTSPLRGEVTLGVLAANGGGMVEAGVLADLGRAALGGLVTLGAVNEHLGVGLHLAGGPRFALSGRARLDLQLDLGLIRFGDDGEGSGFTVTERSGSEEVRPSVGARLGLTMTRATSGWFVSVGAGIRHVPRSTVQYTVTECPFLGPCRTTPATATYGGTLAGAYLTVGRPHPRR